MYLVELYNLIEEGENSTTEFKRKFSTPEKIAKEMIAFANTKGGYMLFGVDDNKALVGVESEKEQMELIKTAATFYCEPEVLHDIEVVLIKGVDVVVVHIPESQNKPHYLITDDEDNMKSYVRLNDKSILASKETLRILKGQNSTNPLSINIGENEKALFKFLNENEKITVKGFKKLVNISERRASRTLVNLVRAGTIRHHYTGKEEYFTL
ncbi:MAG TPA: RNA-binding domain-containing protein [Ignavibacteria bacterium]|nr:RNA-binding domain-containing protein [Ignavibacteria bacterium]